MEEDLINKRFNEHRDRQGLSSPSLEGQEEEVHSSTDKSRKGSVDDKILPLVNLINSTDNFFTTSTCSGRVILFANESIEVGEGDEGDKEPCTSKGPKKKIKKKGCRWFMVTHEEAKIDQVLESWKNAKDTLMQMDVSFKVEPAILHVQCRTLHNAKKLIHTATESGFRNSGMVIGKDNRITVAIRSTLGMEVPLPCTHPPSFSESYLAYLTNKANEKMTDNWIRLEKLTNGFQKTFIPS